MKVRWLTQTVVILITIVTVSCSRPLENEQPSETLSPSPNPTVETSVAARYTPSPLPLTEEASTGGDQLAFVSDRRQRGDLDIWLFDLESSQAESLTADEFQDVRPAWSPDGQMLAFMSFRTRETVGIRMIGIKDGNLRVLVSPEPNASVMSFVWSGDGKSIFYTMFDGEAFESEIWQVDVETGKRQYVVAGEAPIAVSVDDQYLAFSIRGSEPRSRTVLRVLRLSDRSELTPEKENFSPSKLAWMPMGDALAVVSGEVYPPLATYTVSDEKVLLQTVDPQTAEPGTLPCDLAWSPDGTTILVTRATPTANTCRGELLLYDLDSMHYRLLPIEGPVSNPEWSTDGRWIVYGKNDTMNIYQYRNQILEQVDGEIWIAELTGLDDRPLIADSFYNGQPAWRP